MFNSILREESAMLGLAGVIVFLIAWQITAVFNWVNPLFISSPKEVFSELFSFFKTGFIYPHLLISFEEFLLGLTLAIILGIFCGLITGWYKKIYAFSNLLVIGLYSMPYIALLPLIIIWVGLGISAKIIVVFLAAFFPVLINTSNAVKNLDYEFIKLGKSFGASDIDIFKKITLPSSLPFIITGIKLAIPRAIIGMIVAEFFASNIGLGYLISFYGTTFQTAKFLAIIFVVITISILATFGMERIEKYFQSWKPKRNGL